MQAEQQQRILGYFIEEAQDHLDTIEQGLLKLQSTLEDPDLLYEVYRAAHSVKGGAAMLGLTSIQTTAHRLEDSFKILEKIQAQSRLQVDQDLESSFLEVSDTLKALIESLSSPYGLTDEVGTSLLQKVEPTFDRLNSQLESLAEQHEVVLTELSLSPPAMISTPVTVGEKTAEISPVQAIRPPENSAKELFFRSDVPDQLREMLQLFRQGENPSSRKALIEICQSLGRAGETFDLSNWTKFISTVERVIANPANSYSTLAPIIIKAVKQAQELVLENREVEVEASSDLKHLLLQPAFVEHGGRSPNGSAFEPPKKNEVMSSGIEENQERISGNSIAKVDSQCTRLKAHIELDEPTDEEIESFLDDWSAGEPTIDASKPPSKGPQIDSEELKRLAELFEGENLIEQGWQEEHLIQGSELDSREGQSNDNSIDRDFLDLFDEQTQEEKLPASSQHGASATVGGSKPVSSVDRSSSKKADARGVLDATDLHDLLNIGMSSSSGSSPSRLTSDEPSPSLDDLELENLSFDDLFDEGSSARPAAINNSSKAQWVDESQNLETSDWFDQLIQGESKTDSVLNAQQTPELDSRPTSTKSTTQPMASASPDAELDSEDWFEHLFGTADEKTDSQQPPATVSTKALKTYGTSGETDDLSELEQLLDSTPSPERSNSGLISAKTSGESQPDELFLAELDGLDALLQAPDEIDSQDKDEDLEEEEEEEENYFADLERLLGGDEGSPGTGATALRQRGTAKQTRVFEPIAKVPVKQLDNLSNLMGELVVNRNSLEQDQERMRQFLDNLLDQVSLLSDVGQRMQDFYERSLLEISLLSGRKQSVWNSPGRADDKHSKNRIDDPIARLYEDFESTELDRFTPFHTLSQEIIELVVRVRESAADIEFLVEEADQVTRQLRQVTTQLEEGLTKARMEPFSQEADRLARPVRDISIKCGKQAQLYVEGRETLIDKMLFEKLHEALVHLVNNAIAHGIELPDVRQAAGKSPKGRIAIKVFHQGNQTVIAVSDDGAGIDVEKVKEKAIRKRLVTPEQAATMSNLDVYDLLFHAGFSMKEQADELSGRGVGMYAVRTCLDEIRGTITTDSTLGKGTTFTIRLPLNMSISRALCCISDRARIAFPMDGVEEMIDVPAVQIRMMADGKQAIEWRGSLLPFRHLRELLTYKRHLGRGNVYGTNTEEDMISVIVLRSAGTYLGVMVDQVLAEQEIVIKQLEGPVPKPVGIAGATVLGDGQIVAIADVLELIDLAMGRIRKEPSPWPTGISAPTEPQQQKNQPTVLIVDDSITVRSLLSITFEKSGYRVEEARDGKEAWEKLKSGLPCDLVFCDIEMPRMDGLELLSRMQKDPALIDLPIAMLTSRGADRHRQMAYQLGARGYFTKPYLEEQLLEAAGRMLRGEVVGKPIGMALTS
ncbi:response regulator [Capilliphycus salinus ALCB114379]|uniref:hybrid sensor histidine kinase/response regulator n=1 Tax=Capilliphycus salinus TaxID=2768948 RepID=UPI0039A6CCCA